MKKIFILTLGLLFAASCSNDNDNIVKSLDNEPVTVREVQGANDLFVFELPNTNAGLPNSYIVPSSTLSAEYKQDGLFTFISGNVTNNSVVINGYILDDIGNSVTLNGNYNTVEVKTMSELIPFTEYSLYETGCWWTNYEQNKVIIINSEEELDKHIACSGSDTYPEIDFSKHTLLFASGSTSYGVSNVSGKVYYISGKYVLNVEVLLNDTTAISNWKIALLIDKLDAKSKVELNINIIRN